MGLEGLRGRWERVIRPLVARMGGVEPCTLTWLTLPLALWACYLITTAGRDQEGAFRLVGGTLLVLLASVLDAMDGNIARTHGKTTRYGDYLDHTIDRVVDIALLLAIGHNAAWVPNAVWGWAAALATLFGSYMGTQAQSVGLGRNYGGFGRADRLAVILLAMILAAIQASTGWSDPVWLGIGWNPLLGAVLISFIGGLWTFIVRFGAARVDLQRLDAHEPLTQTENGSIEDDGE